MRMKAPRRIDSKIFRRGAKGTRSINVKPTIMRGGTRL